MRDDVLDREIDGPLDQDETERLSAESSSPPLFIHNGAPSARETADDREPAWADPTQQAAGMDALLKIATPVPPESLTTGHENPAWEDFSAHHPEGRIVRPKDAISVRAVATSRPPLPRHEGVQRTPAETQDGVWGKSLALQSAKSGRPYRPAGQQRVYRPNNGRTAELPVARETDDNRQLTANDTPTQQFNTLPKVRLNPEARHLPNTDHAVTEQLPMIPPRRLGVRDRMRAWRENRRNKR